MTNGLPKQLEPKDKLGADMVNGPEGLPPETGLDTVDWDWVDWSDCEGRYGDCGSESSRRRGKATRLVLASCRRGLRARPGRKPA